MPEMAWVFAAGVSPASDRPSDAPATVAKVVAPSPKPVTDADDSALTAEIPIACGSSV